MKLTHKIKITQIEILMKTYSNQYITDYLGRIIAVLSPPPNDPSYHESTQRAANKMTEEAAKAHLNTEQERHDRGNNFTALNVGLSYGNEIPNQHAEN
jgi:hypothetical protein